MSIILNIKVEDVESLLDTSGFASIQLVRATSVDGAYSLLTTIALVDDQIMYEYEDTTGTTANWYKYRYYNAVGPLASSYTNPFRPPFSSRVKILQSALETYDAGVVLASTSGGTTSSVVTTDYRFKDGKSAGRGKGGWLRVASGSYAGQVSNISNTDRSAGTFTLSPAISGALSSGDAFEWHWLVNPNEWYNAINRAMQRYWYLDRVAIIGDGNPEQVLDDLTWLKNKSQITGLWEYPNGSLVERPYSWWNARQENGLVTLMTSPSLTSADTVYLEALRSMDELYTDDSVLAPSCNIDLAAALAYDEVLHHLTRPGSAAATQERLEWLQARQMHKSRLRALYQRYGPRPRLQRPTWSEPSGILVPWIAR